MEINPNDHKPVPPVSEKKTSFRLSAAICTLLLAALAGAWLIFFPDSPIKKPALQVILENITPEKSLQHPDLNQADQPGQVDDERVSLENPAPDHKQKAAPRTEETQELTAQQHCDLLTRQLTEFFNHLDNETYIKEFSLNQPTLYYFSELTTKLLANPPVVARESDDLYTILTNMAHFFRIIGRQNILLMKGILDRERDKIEDVAAELFQVTIIRRCSGESFPMNAPLDKVYEYAGFFLNTMGGRSYLFRRDSRSRLLVNYYALLIVDQANKENMNKYGLDIREIIPGLIREIEATNQLIYKEDYIDKLEVLRDKYLNH